ncbi:hypothetical protein [Lysobacter sp. Root604]|uniref:hypothetical protein n=1 Tax=Lysobacter sp. Root604 TaxID=1736568 RepID=UPI0012FA9774|nr:hypothetical protein [Lysobacter sp. Root604]
MLQDIIKAGGTSFLIFGVVFAIGLYAVRGLHGLQGRRGQHRREFLELWADGRPRDALWLQVAVRHAYGTHLPAPVIRLGLTRPDSSQALVDLSELWDLFHYDSDTQTVRWFHRHHATLRRRKLALALVVIGYFSFALTAVVTAYVTAHYGPSTAFGWIYGFFTAIAAWVAFSCLIRMETLTVAVRVGDAWIKRINRASRRARKRRLTAPT